MPNEFGYQGNYSEEEEESGYNEFALRTYDPTIGRWLSNDPYDQFASPYIGMGNNPVNNVDPDGGGVLDFFGPGNPVIAGIAHSAAQACGATLAQRGATLAGSVAANVVGHSVAKTLYPLPTPNASNLQRANLGSVMSASSGFSWKRVDNFIGQEIEPRIIGTFKVAGGLAIMFVGAATSEVGVGVPVFAFGADYGATGLYQMWYGRSHRTMTMQGLVDNGMGESDADEFEALASGTLSMMAGAIPVRTATSIPAVMAKTEAAETNIIAKETEVVNTRSVSRSYQGCEFVDDGLSMTGSGTPSAGNLITLSKKRFGHTFTTHGQDMTDFLINRAKGSDMAQGQFLNNQAAANFILQNLDKIKKGAQLLPIPKNFPARVIMPDGTFAVPTSIKLVPGGNGVKTAYPEL